MDWELAAVAAKAATDETKDGKPARTLCLVDGSGFIFRAFHALPPLTRADGTPVNAVLGFCNMLYKLARDYRCDAIAVLFDTARVTFRNDIYPDYKANRPEPPAELVPQFPLVREATRAFGLPAIEVAGFEADDLIATYVRDARARGDRVTIVSSDKDLMQLVGDGVVMLDPIKMREIGADEVRERFGVGPDKVIDVQALAGDSTDNVPGVPGIGVKTAAQLIEAFGDLDTLLARAGEITQPKRRQTLLDNAELARTSRELVTLRDDAPVPEPVASFGPLDPEPEALTAFLKAQEFKALLARIQADLGWQAEAGPAPGRAPQPKAKDIAYELVQSVDELQRWADAAVEAGRVAVDTETTSLDAMRAKLVGVSLSIEPGRACYVPLGHRPPDGE
ncbi:MAG TPA: 5'-3' exonuclease H3TH domain-containing protein, partial [Alphaproteobacteria bacterium]